MLLAALDRGEAVIERGRDCSAQTLQVLGVGARGGVRNGMDTGQNRIGDFGSTCP
jgi:hypothetical protein